MYQSLILLESLQPLIGRLFIELDVLLAWWNEPIVLLLCCYLFLYCFFLEFSLDLLLCCERNIGLLISVWHLGHVFKDPPFSKDFAQWGPSIECIPYLAKRDVEHLDRCVSLKHLRNCFATHVLNFWVPVQK